MSCFLLNFLPHAYAVKTDLGDYNTIGDFATAILNWAQPIIAVLAGIMLIVAGYFYLTSGGNPEQIKLAKEIVLGVVLGLALLYLASLLFSTIGITGI